MRIAAFFDIDGTLIGPPSLERRFLRHLRWRGGLGAHQAARWLLRFLGRAASDWLAATHGNKRYLAGVSTASLEQFLMSFQGRPLEIFPEAERRLEWHAAQGHKIFLVSGTLEPLAEAVCRQLAVSAAPCATRLETDGAHWTGDILGEAVSGPGKVGAIERLVGEHGLDLGCSYAYGDSWSDRWMLARVGHPVAINPSLRLEWLARCQGWPVLRWQETTICHRGAERTEKGLQEQGGSVLLSLGGSYSRRKG